MLMYELSRQSFIDKLIELKKLGPQSLGMHPDEGLSVFVLTGPFGPYLQLGEASKEKDAPKPKRAGIPKGVTPDDIDLEKALAMLALLTRQNFDCFRSDSTSFVPQ